MISLPDELLLSFVKYTEKCLWIRVSRSPIAKKKQIKTAELFLFPQVNQHKLFSLMIRNVNHSVPPTGSRVNTDSGVFKNVTGCIQVYDSFQMKFLEFMNREYDKNPSNIIHLHSISNSDHHIDSVDVTGYFNYQEALRILQEGINNKVYCTEIPFVFTTSENKKWRRDCEYSKNNVILERVKFGQRI